MADRPRLLFYCQHAVGMGHLVRALALARALATRFRVVFLNGGPVPRGVPRPPGVEFVDLPPLGLDADGRLVSRDGRRSLAQALPARRRMIRDAFGQVRPSVVLVELFPFGRKKFAPELLPLFDAVHAAGRGRPFLATSLRDILVTGRTDQAEHDERACRLANRYLDAVLVHADPRFARLEESFRPRAPLRVPVHYTGFVLDERPAPVRAGRVARDVLVSAGGGFVGGALLRAAIDAHERCWQAAGLRTTIVAGPFLPEAEWRAVRMAARRRAGLTLRRTVPDLGAELATAAVSVSQCGYTTALEILRAGVPALVVPFGGPEEDEQRVRARRLAEAGVVRVLAPERLDPDTLGAEVEALRHRAPAAIRLDLDGAQRTAALLATLVRRPARRAHRAVAAGVAP